LIETVENKLKGLMNPMKQKLHEGLAWRCWIKPKQLYLGKPILGS